VVRAGKGEGGKKYLLSIKFSAIYIWEIIIFREKEFVDQRL